MYVRQLSLLHLLIWASYRHFYYKERGYLYKLKTYLRTTMHGTRQTNWFDIDAYTLRLCNSDKFRRRDNIIAYVP